MSIGEGEEVAQFVRASWRSFGKLHCLVDIYRLAGPIQKMWHVYYLHWMRADEYVESALVVYEDESGSLQIGSEQDGHVYTDEQGLAMLHHG
jgi:hypothetical protein